MQVRWSGIPISKNFPQFVVIHTVKGFGIVNKADVCLFVCFQLSCFFDDPMNACNLFSDSSAFSKCITMNKAGGVDGILVELLQILKADAMKVLHLIFQQVWSAQQWPQDWKKSVFIPVPKKGNAKECSNYHTFALISHVSKVILNILQARLQQYLNCKISDVQAGFRKGRGTKDQIVNIRRTSKKSREFQKKTSTSTLLTMPKPLTVWITTNCGKFLKRWESQTMLPAS